MKNAAVATGYETCLKFLSKNVFGNFTNHHLTVGIADIQTIS